jgi:hypothetical protein
MKSSLFAQGQRERRRTGDGRSSALPKTSRITDLAEIFDVRQRWVIAGPLSL